MAVFESLIQLMVDAGASYVFIWLLFAAIVYGLLEKYEVFGESSATAGASLGASLFILLGIYAFAPEGLFLSFGAALGFIVMGIFGTVIVLSLAGFDVTELETELGGDNKVAGIGFILVVVGFLGAIAYNLNWDSLVGDVGNAWQDIVFPVLFLIFLLAIVRWMTE